MNYVLRGFVVAMTMLFSLGATGEDIDIYSGNTQSTSNLLIVIDNSSNWTATLGSTTNFQAEINALAGVLDYLRTPQVVEGRSEPFIPGEGVNIGLMMFNETGDNGGYVRFGLRPMTDTNASALRSIILDLVPSGSNSDSSGSNQPYGKTLYEAMLYLRAQDAGFGAHPVGSKRRDFAESLSTGNTPDGTRSTRDYGLTSEFAFVPGTNQYRMPDDDGCGKNYILFISNGDPGTGGDAGGTTSASLLDAAVLSAYPGAENASKRAQFSSSNRVSASGREIHASTADEWARFLQKTYGYVVYTTAVYQPNSSGLPRTSDQNMINLMSSMAKEGEGKYFPSTSPEQLAANIGQVVNEVRATNSVFVSASLPVSVNTQGTYLNQVYMGMFRPTTGPRWMGNLKRYKFAYDATTDSIALVGVSDPAVSAINPSNGFISPDTQSFWSRSSKITGTTPNGFWAERPRGETLGDQRDDIPDGEIVEKGGVAGQIRREYLTTQANRKIYTCPIAGCTPRTDSADGTQLSAVKFDLASPGIFTSTNSDHQELFDISGASASTDLASLIAWIRGTDNKGDERGPGGTVTVRPSIHGDVLHSRPVAVNYPALNQVVVFYGANDGLLRAIDAGKADNSETVENLQDKGRELWAFVAPEHYKQFKRLRDDEPVVKLATTPSLIVPPPKPKEYFFDGNPSIYQEGANVWLFMSARRGGRFIYAFDVSNPEDPKFMWKVDNNTVQNSQAVFAELGQTWSTPRVTKLKGSIRASDGTLIPAGEPVLIFGAGYAGGFNPTAPYVRIEEDLDNPDTDYNYSRGVFIVQARNGKLIRFIRQGSSESIQITRSVPSDVALVDSNFDGFSDLAYFGDLGGNVWRLNLEALNTSNQNDASAWTLTKVAALEGKFFYPPDVVLTSGFRSILIGSGNREDPRDNDSLDRFYMLKDMGSGTTLTLSDLANASSGNVPTSSSGWYLPLLVGEKVVNAALTVGGITYFGTNQPDSSNSQCAGELGIARAYAVSFLGDAAPSVSPLSGGGLPPSPVAGIVEISVDGVMKLVPFIIGSGEKGSPIEAAKVTISVPPIRRKNYWYSRED